MKKGLLALGALFAICLSLLATDMVVKQKNGEIKKFNVDDVEEVFFEEKANIPDDSTVVDASETLLRFDISSDSTAEVTGLKIGGVDELIIPAKVRIDDKVYTVTSIKDFAFDTNYLGSVMIPSSITKLYGLTISTNFTVSKDNPAFSSLDGVLYDKEKTKVIKAPEKLKGDLVIPASVTSIGESAFYYCVDLTNIKIPEGVTSIGAGAFSGCVSLDPKLLIYDNGTKCYGWIGDEKKCIEVVIPEGVTSIGNAAFFCYGSLSKIEIAESVTSIGYSAFEGCRSLTNINIPKSVTTIENKTFSSCSNLASIKIPERVTSIGDYAFSDCSSLTSIKIPEGVTKIGTEAFRGCSSLTSINIPKNLTSFGSSSFGHCSGLTTIEFSEGLTSIGNEAFLGCDNLTSINIPETVLVNFCKLSNFFLRHSVLVCW